RRPSGRVATAGLCGVEAEGGEDGGEAGADLVEFGGGDVFDAGDFAAAEVVDGEVEAVAGAGAAGGVDLAALGDADVLLLVVAMGEGDAGDLDFVAGFGLGDVLNDGGAGGLPGAGGGGGVRDDAEVDVGAGEGGCGKGILGHGDYGAEAGAARGGAGVEVEGADLAVGVREGPGSGVVEGEMVGG